MGINIGKLFKGVVNAGKKAFAAIFVTEDGSGNTVAEHMFETIASDVIQQVKKVPAPGPDAKSADVKAYANQLAGTVIDVARTSGWSWGEDLLKMGETNLLKWLTGGPTSDLQRYHAIALITKNAIEKLGDQMPPLPKGALNLLVETTFNAAFPPQPIQIPADVTAAIAAQAQP